MKRILFLTAFLLSLNFFAQNGLWEKKGITGGIIQDLIKDKNLTLYYILTDSGIYKSQFLTDWSPMNEGLFDFSPIEGAFGTL